MKLFPASLLFIISPVLIYGQSLYYPFSIPYLSSAKTGENFITGLNAAFNPSVIPYLKNIEAGMYAEKKYMTNIDLLVLSFCAPFNNNGIAFLFQHFGNTAFNERILGLNYGKNFGAVSAGVLFRGIQVKISNAPASTIMQTGIFSSVKINDNLFAGINIVNPKFAAKAADRFHAASAFSMVMGWQSSGVVYAGLESKKEEGRPLSIIFTLQYRFAEKFTGGLNWCTTSQQPFVCIGWKLMKVMIEAGCSYHATLGPSPSVSLLYKNINTGR